MARQNKVHVVVNVRFARSLKYVDIWDCLYDTGWILRILDMMHGEGTG